MPPIGVHMFSDCFAINHPKLRDELQKRWNTWWSSKPKMYPRVLESMTITSIERHLASLMLWLSRRVVKMPIKQKSLANQELLLSIRESPWASMSVCADFFFVKSQLHLSANIHMLTKKHYLLLYNADQPMNIIHWVPQYLVWIKSIFSFSW